MIGVGRCRILVGPRFRILGGGGGCKGGGGAKSQQAHDLQIKLKLHLLLFYPSTWYICDFFLFHIEIEGKCGWIIGGPKGMMAPPPLKIKGGGAGPMPPFFLRLC